VNFLSSLNVIQLIALVAMGIGVVGFAFTNRAKIGTFLGRFKFWGGGGTTTITQTQPLVVDDDTLDFQAHGRLQKRFTRLKCPEGLQACVTQLQHFYHAEGHK